MMERFLTFSILVGVVGVTGSWTALLGWGMGWLLDVW
jgi:hypothetical protein